jgi:dipeptidyl aminopeptidase/acylaminoacyl peptidase
MRKFILTFSGIFVLLNIVESQKKRVDFSTPSEWPIIQSESITGDGKFVSYSVNVAQRKTHFIVEATDLSWKTELIGATEAWFTNDSKRIVFRNEGDSLGVLELGKSNISYTSKVADFKLPENGGGAYLAFRIKDSASTLELRNLYTGETKQFRNIRHYLFNPTGRVLLMTMGKQQDSIGVNEALCLDLIKDKITILCHCSQADNFTFDRTGSRLAFLTEERQWDVTGIFVRCYWDGMDSAKQVIGPSTKGMTGLAVINDGIFFNDLGDKLFFWVGNQFNQEMGKSKTTNVGARVSIRGLHEFELNKKTGWGPFLAMTNLNRLAKEVIRLQQNEDKGQCWVDNRGKYMVTTSNLGASEWETKWNVLARPDIYLVDTRDGSRRLLKKRLLYTNTDMYLSPSGKYVIWFDQLKRHWVSYDIALNKTRNITSRINTPLYVENDGPARTEKLVGWMEKSNDLLIYDRYDIWQVDPEGKKMPINLTHGYGIKRRYRFRCINCSNDLSSYVRQSDTLILSAIDLNTKRTGFFRLILKNKDLEELTMSAHLYILGANDFYGARSAGPIRKARYSNTYVLSRMSPIEYPNLYITTDFRSYGPLTDLAPQKEYNWYTTSLIHWRLPDGRLGEGILFKPEDFDPKRKYPIIFYYYERNSSNLNIYIHTSLSNGPMSVPWFVSNGYLVFVPDIHYKVGHPGQSSCDAVVSAAGYLAKKPWVDSHRMGLQGHSYGGFETNYIISHSTLFKAAAPASAVSNLTSSYGQTNEAYYYESGQGRIGASLWQRPDLYLENSPVFAADKVSAAVLIMHTKNDGRVPYLQGLQWYNALRRLGKKVWLLTYEGEIHTLSNEKNQLDYSIRLSQFFDYYLKSLPPPNWMTRGVLDEMMPIDDGLELDTSGRRP